MKYMPDIRRAVVMPRDWVVRRRVGLSIMAAVAVGGCADFVPRVRCLVWCGAVRCGAARVLAWSRVV